LGFTRRTLSLTLSQTHNKHDSNALPIYWTSFAFLYAMRL
jgi:hypothetical protein